MSSDQSSKSPSVDNSANDLVFALGQLSKAVDESGRAVKIGKDTGEYHTAVGTFKQLKSAMSATYRLIEEVETGEQSSGSSSAPQPSN